MLSLAFCFMVFGNVPRIAVWGPGGLVFDSLIQSVFVAFMSSLLPTLLTRRRLGHGSIRARPARMHLPRNAVARALGTAGMAALLGGSLHALGLSFGPSAWPFESVAILKTVYGALLGAIVARFAAIAALSDTAA